MITNNIKAQYLSRPEAEYAIDRTIETLEEVHIDPYKYYDKAAFYADIRDCKMSLPDSVTEKALRNSLQRNIAKLRDGHTQIFLPGYAWVDYTKAGGKVFPIDITFDKGRLYVKKLYVKSGLREGDEILAINNINVDSITGYELELISAESDCYRNYRFESDFRRILWNDYSMDGGFFDVKYLRNNKIDNCKIEGVKLSNINPGDEENYFYKEVDGVGYIRVNVMYDSKDERFAKFTKNVFKRLGKQNVDNLIIDFRYNDGGNSALGNMLLSSFCEEQLPACKGIRVKKSQKMVNFYKSYFGKFKYFFVKQLLPFLKAENGTVHEIEPSMIYPKKKRYTGHVYLLTSNRTFSSADSFARIFQANKMGKIVGEETGGKGIDFGEIIQTRIPGTNLYFDISCKEFFDVGDYGDSGVMPDVKVDENMALEKAMELIKKD